MGEFLQGKVKFMVIEVLRERYRDIETGEKGYIPWETPYGCVKKDCVPSGDI
jgi:hypothetical protein